MQSPRHIVCASCRFQHRSFFFFNYTPPTEIYTLSYTTLFRSNARAAHPSRRAAWPFAFRAAPRGSGPRCGRVRYSRSEEHTSELQSRQYLVCRLLLEKKKEKTIYVFAYTEYIRSNILSVA